MALYGVLLPETVAQSQTNEPTAFSYNSYSLAIEQQIEELTTSVSTDPHHDKDIRAILKTLLTHYTQDFSFIDNRQLALTSLSGTLDAHVIDITHHGKHVHGEMAFYLRMSNKSIPLIFIEPPNQKHGQIVSLTGFNINSKFLVLPDDINTDGIEQLPADSLQQASSPVIAKSIASQSVLPQCSSLGQQNALIVGVNYIDDNQQLPTPSYVDELYSGAAPSLSTYISETSYDQSSLTTTNLGWFTASSGITSSNACTMYNEIRSEAIDYAASQVDISQYTRLFIVMRELSGGCGYVGRATTSCSIYNSSDSQASANLSVHWVLGSEIDETQPRDDAVDLLAHEYGHNLGMQHAELLDWGSASTGPILDNSGATILQTADNYDPMGGSNRLQHFNAQHKNQINWLNEIDIQTVNGSGLLTIAPVTQPSPSLPRAVKLYRGANAAGKKEYFWLETKSNNGLDSNASSDAHGGIQIHQQFDENDTHTYLIDPKPLSGSGSDLTLLPGESWFDPFSGITIQHTGIDQNENITINIQTLPDFIDSDEDGVIASLEIAASSDPLLTDSDNDGYNDKFEICFDGNCEDYIAHTLGMAGSGDLNPGNPDTDGDGMYDRWEQINGFDPLDNSDATGDADDDGITNLDEFLAGTDPQGGDSDGDGLADGFEISIGTDVNNADTDGDTMGDGWEYNNSLNPLESSDASLDNDFDTLSNLTEYQLGTNPNAEDSDGDNLKDQDEVNFYQTNPARYDTDDDRLSDYEELANGTDPNTISPDTDNDGMHDDWELARGTDINNRDSAADPDNDGSVNIVEYLRYTLPLSTVSSPALTTWYVDPTADPDLENGSATQPYSRIDRALAVAQAGDTLLLASGTYNSNTEQVINFNKAIRVIGSADKSAVLQGLSVATDASVNWMRFENLTVEMSIGIFSFSSDTRFAGNHFKSTNGVVLRDSVNTTFQNNIFNNQGGARELGVINSSNVDINNNTFSGANLAIELDANSQSSTVKNNIITNNTSFSGVSATMLSFNIITSGELVGDNGNLQLSPIFVNEIAGNYHLASGSPGIALGDPTSNYQLEPSPNGFRINLGAYGGTSDATPVTDSDNDRLPDEWESLFGLSTTTSNIGADSDSDGVWDYHEYFAGTEPDNGTSVPALAGSDIDNDGVDDAIDNCSGVANPAQEDLIGNGTGDACREGHTVPLIPPLHFMLLIVLGYLAFNTSRYHHK